MPSISLIVCVLRQRDLFERLLRNAYGCCDELVVQHDIPDVQNLRQVVEAAGGRFLETPPATLEEILPFTYGQARHDWILRLDADEFPSEAMKKWIQDFRQAPEPPDHISGYTCIWPAWDGHKTITKRWPAGRVFLFHRQRVRSFGIGEQTVIPDGVFQPLNFILHHQPKRKSLGLYNVLIRKEAYKWRTSIAQALLGKPTDLPCWRWTDLRWPLGWEQIRQQPLQTAARRLVMETLRTLRDQWRADKRMYLEAALNGPIFHAMLCLKFWQMRRRQLQEIAKKKNRLDPLPNLKNEK
jgi:hypothetical protein